MENIHYLCSVGNGKTLEYNLQHIYIKNVNNINTIMVRC